MNKDSLPRREEEKQDRVVIAATVAALFGRGAAIRHIRAISGGSHGTWVRQGRLDIQSSHETAPPLIRPADRRPQGDL